MHGILNSIDAHMRIGLPNSFHLKFQCVHYMYPQYRYKGTFSLYALNKRFSDLHMFNLHKLQEFIFI